MKKTRIIFQILFLLLFLLLFVRTESVGTNETKYPIKLFFDLDPLVYLSTGLSSHWALKPLIWSLVVILITLIFGRVFCGWFCPLGTIHHFFGWLKGRWTPLAQAIKEGGWSKWNHAKYYLLLALLISSIFTGQQVGLFDPLALLYRSLTNSVYPIFNYTVTGFFGFLYSSGKGFITGVSEPVYSFFKKFLLPFHPSFYVGALGIGIVFIGIILLNFIRKRFWCRYICPLGALLGFFSRFSLFKEVTNPEICTSCKRCAAACQTGAEPDSRKGRKNTECIVCGNCREECPEGAIDYRFVSPSFKKLKETPGLDLTRRHVIGSLIGGASAFFLMRVNPLLKRSDPHLIRPPGALPEKDFLSKCIKCSECIRICPTNALHPAFLEAGFEGMWSPILVPRLGYCEYGCVLCGNACPTGAIEALPDAVKNKTKIGLAFVDTGRCLPYAFQTPCIVCEEHCPTPKKAIWFEEVKVIDRDGNSKTVKLPHVDPKLCIGCGICENKCPVADSAAIYVTSVGESRSATNQLLITTGDSPDSTSFAPDPSF